jgi:hypothetical protein
LRRPRRILPTARLLLSLAAIVFRYLSAANLYDYIYSIFIRHEINVDRAEIIQTFLDKTIFRPDPTAAKNLLLGLPFERFKNAWDKYIVCPKSVWIRFDEGLQRFRENMEELFQGVFFRQRQLTFFPAQYRNPIMDAGSSMTLLRLTYSGVERLVEPYSLVYKRRQDGTAQEYFYAYDRTGGRDSGPDIKTFVASGVQAVAPTEEKFEPRYPVELSKAGEPAGKGYFGGSFSGGGPRRVGGLIRRARARIGMVYVLQCPY